MSEGQMIAWITDTRTAAANPEHEWDKRALDWPMLVTQSVVVEVGGYKGRWALQMARRYRARLFVFEPQTWAAQVCRAVLGDAAQVYNVALGDRDETLTMGDWETDGCSFVKPGAIEGQMREIKGMFDQCQITKHIDLMLVNIEGYEYTLLPHMFDQGIYPDRLMVQFHDFADPDGLGALAIGQRMHGRYHLAWDYGVLTAWEKA